MRAGHLVMRSRWGTAAKARHTVQEKKLDEPVCAIPFHVLFQRRMRKHVFIAIFVRQITLLNVTAVEAARVPTTMHLTTQRVP